MSEKVLSPTVRRLVYAALGVLLVWLLFRYALPLTMPFLIALILAHLMEPAVCWLSDKLRVRRPFASALCAAMLLCAVIALIVLIVWRASYELTAFVKSLPSMLSGVSGVLSSLEDRFYGWTVAAPPEIQSYISGVLKSFSEKSTALPGELSGKLLSAVTNAASNAPRITLFAVTCAIALFFVSANYGGIKAFFLRQLPEDKLSVVRTVYSDLRSSLGSWLKAQLILSGITAAELSVVFFLLRIDYAILLALLVALIDALPVIGSGTVLLPWALTSLIGGNVRRAFVLIAAYAAVTIVRSTLEPKLVGAKLGLPPVAALAAIYAGFCALGVFGMLLFPVALIMIKQLNDRGIVKLWK